MYFLPQVLALRNAHAAVRSGDNSPATLGVLVRGYATLGQLTILYWNATPKVYIARSLLYAQRMVAANPTSADAYWHRAYARAMAGFHADALDDLKKAKELAKEDKPPSWVELLEPYCKFDTRALLDLAAADKDRAPLATFLSFLTVEYSASQRLVMELGQGARELNPLSDRIVEAVTSHAGVGPGHEWCFAGHRVVAAALLSSGQTLPATVRTAFPAKRNADDESMAFTADIAKALLLAGNEDVGEPSWGAVSIRRVRFTKHFLPNASSICWRKA